MVAQQLHRENIEQVVQDALSASGVSVAELAAVATTVKPGLALSLEVGLRYSLDLVNRYQKPFIPIHHMEAHALTVRLTHHVEFPFLVLLLSGGHCLLAVAQGVSDFLLLGQSIDIAPGDMLDKVIMALQVGILLGLLLIAVIRRHCTSSSRLRAVIQPSSVSVIL